MELLEGICSRKSVRNYTTEPVSDELLQEMLLAGSRAPSGLNNQPWRFVTIRGDAVKELLASLTKYQRIVRSAPLLIAIFIDKTVMYNEVKDHQAMGACIQNMLLAAHAKGLGAVWLGEIMKNGEQVRQVLGVSGDLEFMALVAVGHPAVQGEGRTGRLPLKELLVREL